MTDCQEESPAPTGCATNGRERVTQPSTAYTPAMPALVWDHATRQVVSRLKKGYLLLNIKGEEAVLSVGKKLPKPGKELKEDFCKATLPLEALKELAFDFPHTFAEAKIMHRLIIEDIQIPEEYKGDFEKARIMAKRKGRLVRVLDVDGRHEEKEAAFVV